MQGHTFQELIVGYRTEKLKLSVRETALLLGLHYTYLSRLENGLSQPSDDVLERLAKVFGLSVQEKAELFLSVKLTPSFHAVMQETLAILGQKKAAEIMFRTSKGKKKSN